MARDIEKLSAEKLPKSNEILERAKKVLLSPQATGPFRAPSCPSRQKRQSQTTRSGPVGLPTIRSYACRPTRAP